VVISEAREEESHDQILHDLRAGEQTATPAAGTSGRPLASAPIDFPDPVTIEPEGDGYRTIGLGRSVRISNPDKPFFGDQYRKGDLIQYYASISPMLLPHLEGRALSMARYPDGAGGSYFYEKQCPSHAPEWLARAPIHSTHRGEPIEFCTVSDAASLVWVANMACIEMHPWLSRAERHDLPDFAVFDLDPQEGATWEQVTYTAGLVKVILDKLGLDAYAKTSGSTGIHVYVPIEPHYSYARVRGFVESVGKLIAAADPEVVTMEWDIARRGRRVFIDHNQNVGGKTIAAVYSVRPRPGAPVSTPILWEELDSVQPDELTIATIWPRLRQYGDLFAPVLRGGQGLEKAEELLGIPPQD
jgi:bifunctional non-homologous end joining protein LigD